MSWRVPSTPNSRRSVFTQPSTTPAGPPPSYLTDKSTTPPGPPPRSAFGSSFNPSNDTFVRKAAFAVPDDDDDDDDDEEDDASFELDEHVASPPRFPAFTSVPTFNPRGLKRSYDGKVRENSSLAAIAKGMIGHSKPAELREADNVILKSEALISDLDRRVQGQPTRTETTLTETSAKLTSLWEHNAQIATKQGSVGPRANDGFNKATYLATLLLKLHYPHGKSPDQASARFQRSITSSAIAQHGVSLPKALLDWLNTFHTPFPDDFDAVHLHQPSPSAHEAFWDVIYACALRGKLDRVIRLLLDAGWGYADSARDDGNAHAGYTGVQLQNTEAVIADCVATLQTCPAIQHGDWDVKGVEWTSFRQRVRQTFDELETFAEGEDRARRSTMTDNMFTRSSMRDGGDGALSMSAASRRAESRVPWTIYENLRMLYNLLQGSEEDVLMTSQDWLEGSFYLTIWWDGADESNPDEARSGLWKSAGASQRIREVDLTPLTAYRRRLANAFVQVSERGDDDAVFSIDTLDPVQVGLACILENSVSSVLDLLKIWSLPITVSVLEIAALGKWLPLVRPRSQRDLLDQGFSKEDLLVLSHGPAEKGSDGIDRDEILSEYAELLSGKEKIHNREGWELAVAVLNRLDQATKARVEVGDMLDRLKLTEEDRVDKVLQVCNDLGMSEQRRAIAERYADSLAENTQLYGSALIYYARANAVSKLRNTLALLTSMSLLHSAAMPSPEDLDPKLSSLISKDRAELKLLGKSDLEAATLLSSHLSGYATLRKFYEIRDYGAAAVASTTTHKKPLERQRQAAAALFAIIKSASDCIPGGLYDPNAESVVPVDGLLALFGEALPLLGQPTRVFTEQQTFALLGAAEDFAAAPSRIRENASSLLSASLDAYRESNSTASGILKRGRSDLSASSSWDMLASSTMPPQNQANGKSKIQRAWDWRKGIDAIASIDEESEQVLQVFREALVKEVGRGWGGIVSW